MWALPPDIQCFKQIKPQNSNFPDRFFSESVTLKGEIVNLKCDIYNVTFETFMEGWREGRKDYLIGKEGENIEVRVWKEELKGHRRV